MQFHSIAVGEVDAEYACVECVQGKQPGLAVGVNSNVPLCGSFVSSDAKKAFCVAGFSLAIWCTCVIQLIGMFQATVHLRMNALALTGRGQAAQLARLFVLPSLIRKR